VKNRKWRKLRKQGTNEGFQKENTEREETLGMWRHEADKPAAGQHDHVSREQHKVRRRNGTREVRRGGGIVKFMPEET